MRSDDRPSWFLRLAAWGGLVFLHFPILVILLYAFNTEESAYSFPLQGFTLKWFSNAFAPRDAQPLPPAPTLNNLTPPTTAFTLPSLLVRHPPLPALRRSASF